MGDRCRRITAPECANRWASLPVVEMVVPTTTTYLYCPGVYSVRPWGVMLARNQMNQMNPGSLLL